MICYQDVSFCSAPCELQGKCKASFEYAKEEKSKHKDEFIRDIIEICVCDKSYSCPDYKEIEK